MELGLNQKAFVEALKSGRYAQTHCRLRRYDCYCATGVAIAIEGSADWLYDDDDYYIIGNDGRAYAGTLPPEYIELYAFRAKGREVQELNDDGSTFLEIAAAIEAAPERFFTESR